jgi:two-component system nitrogen regulation sensor histidine kinase NtrY
MMLTLAPATVLFALSVFFLNTSIEHLYEPYVLNVVETSKKAIESSNTISQITSQMLEAKYDADGEDAVHFARELSRAMLERGWVNVLEPPEVEEGGTVAAPAPEPAVKVSGSGPMEGDTTEPEVEEKVPSSLEQLANFVEFKRREYNLQTVAVFDRSGKRLVMSSGKELVLPEFPVEDIKRAIEGGQGYNPPISVGERGAVIYAFYPIPRRMGGDVTEIAGAMTVGKYVSWVPQQEWAKLEVASNAKGVIEDYKTMQRMELPIKFSYIILLVFVTLIVIFLSVWFGFYMAKGLTEPIQLLAEGTEMVASGNLDYRIDIEDLGDDELSTVVRSFNKMTEDIQKNRTDLDQAYRSLRETNLELDQRRRYMETVLNHIGAGVLSLDAENRLSTINPAARRMLGHETALKAGVPLEELMHPEEFKVLESLFEELEKSGAETVQRQVTMVREKRSFVILVMASRLRDDLGVLLGTVIVIDDLTELIRAHRAMAWREVARRIAHEIKNPLTPIKLSAQRIERRYAERLAKEEGEIFSESIRTIVRQVDELKDLVNEFSLFARLPSTNPVPERLSDIIGEVVPLYREAHPDLEIKVIEDPRLPLLELDREQMKRVFINLLDNAVASVDGNGEVTIETAYNEQIQVARIEFRDLGPGVPAYVKERLFEPYYSTKPGSSGLGLTIVQRIVSDHYGYIRVMDNEPRGTKFVIELPVVLPERQLKPKDFAKTM